MECFGQWTLTGLTKQRVRKCSYVSAYSCPPASLWKRHSLLILGGRWETSCFMTLAEAILECPEVWGGSAKISRDAELSTLAAWAVDVYCRVSLGFFQHSAILLRINICFHHLCWEAPLVGSIAMTLTSDTQSMWESKLRGNEIRLGRASLNLEVKSTPPPGRVRTEKGRELNLCITKGEKNVEFLKNPERNGAKAREEGKGEIWGTERR